MWVFIELTEHNQGTEKYQSNKIYAMIYKFPTVQIHDIVN